MAATRKLTVEILGDAKGALGAFGQVDGGLSKLGGDFVAFGKKVAVAFAAVAAGAVVIGRDLVNAASDLAENMSKTNVVFGDAADAVIDFSKKAADAFGQSQNQALEAAGNLGIFGKAAGLTGDDLSTFTTDLIGLASDMASFSNTTPQEAIDALGAALRGEAEPIRKYGVLLNDAALKAKAVEMGIYDGNGALTAQQKILAANALIFEQTTDAQGDFARTSDGLANQQRILAARIENVKARLGTALLPIALKVAGAFSTLIERVTPLIERWLPKLQDLFGRVADRVRPVVAAIKDALAPVLERIGDWMKRNTDTVKVFFGVIAGATVLAGIVGLAAALASLFSPIVLIIGAIAAVAAGLYYAYQNSETFRNAVDAVARFFRDTVVPALVAGFNFVKDAIGAFVGFFQERMDAIKAAMTNIKEFFQGVLDVISWLWATFGDTILGYVERAFNGIKTIIEGTFGVLKGIFDFFLGILSGDWSRAWDGIKSVAQGAMDFVIGVVQLAIAPIVAAFELIKIGVGMAINAMKDVVTTVLGTVRSTFVRIFNEIYGFLKGIFDKIAAALRASFMATLNYIIGQVNFVIGLVNGLISAFNLLPGPDIPKVPKIPDFKELAQGGIVTGPTLALIGEAGPEAVVPLSQQYMPDFLKGDADSGGGSTVINIKVDAGLVSSPDQVGQQIIDAIRRAERRSGRVFAAA